MELPRKGPGRPARQIPRSRAHLRLEPEAHAFAAATGNLSGYIGDLLAEQQMRFEEALHILTQRRSLSAAALCAVADAMNGVLWSDDIPAAEQVRAAAESLDPAAHPLSPLDFAALTTLTDAEAEHVRLVVWEVLHGRTL